MKWVLLLVCASLCANDHRIQAYLTIGDTDTAIRLARANASYEMLIRAHAQKGNDRQALRLYRAHIDEDINLLEEIAWSTIKKGATSSSEIHRLAAMLGAVSTQDVQAVPILIEALQSPRPRLRGTALQLAPMLRDKPIQQEVVRLLDREKSFEVRLAGISAIGRMQMQDERARLERIIGSDESTAEERFQAIAAHINMTESAEQIDLERLASDPRAGLRQLACEIIIHLELEEEAIIAKLLQDPRPDVRLTALCALGLLGGDAPIHSLLQDSNDAVAITAAWLLTLRYPEKELLSRFLHAEDPDTQRLAAAAIAKTGKHGLALAKANFQTHSDPYVRANLAIGLLGQREETEQAADVLYQLLMGNEERWMFAEGAHPLFRPLAPSTIKHNPAIPNAPEVANQITRLEILKMLAIIEHPKALDAIRQFLGKHTWGVTGVASITLLEESDDAALDLIRELLIDKNKQVRVQAALALAIWGKDPSAVKTLQEIYPKASRELKIKILEAVGHIGSQDSIPFLLSALDEHFETLRILAAASLIQTLNH